jgi:hypothetical protein
MKVNLKSLSMALVVSATALSSIHAGNTEEQKPARTWSQWASQKAAANNVLASKNARALANQKLQEGNAAVASQQAEAAQEKANKMVDDANKSAADARAKAREAAKAEIAKRQKEIKSLQGQDRELRVQTVGSDARKFRQQDNQATIDQKRAERAARKPASVVRKSAESPF